MSLDVYIRRGHTPRHADDPQLAIEKDGAFWVAGVLQSLRSVVHEALESRAVLDFVGD